MTMSKPKAIFFDWDGTLVDSLGFLLMAHNHVRTTLGESLWTKDDFKDVFKYSSRQMYPKIYPGREELAFDTLAQFMNDNHLDHIKLIDGAVELLEAIHDAGIPMGVVSNKRDAFVKRESTHLGWDKYFKIVTGAGYASQDKPDPEPLLKALAESGLTPGPDVYYVGDTETDLLCARNTGCTAVFLHHGDAASPLIQAYQPYISSTNCVDLLKSLFLPANCHTGDV